MLNVTSKASDRKRYWAAAITLIALFNCPVNAQIEVVTKPGDTLIELLQEHGAPNSPAELQALIATTVRNNGHAFRNRNPDRLIPDLVIVLPLAPPQPPPAPAPQPEPQPLPQPVGTLRVLKGETAIERGAQSTTILAEAPLYIDDRITTAQASRAQLRLDDGSQFELGPATLFVVQEFQEPTNDSPGRLLINLLTGGVRAVSGLIGQRLGSLYRLRTATATIGIRGTEYVARFCVDGCGELPGASVGVLDGAVVLENDAGELRLNQGEFGRAASASSAPASAPLPDGFFDLDRDVGDIVAAKSWLQNIIDNLRSLFR